MAFEIGNSPNSIRSLEIVTSSFEYVQQGIEEVQLAELRWSSVLPTGSIDTNVDPGARTASYLVKDRRGRGNFRGRQADNVSTVGMTMDKVVVPLESSGVSAFVDIQDVRSVQMGYGIDLFTEFGNDMRIASERHIEATFFYGYDDLNYRGFLDYPGIGTTTAALNGGGTSTEWKDKTADEIIFDVITLIDLQRQNSRDLLVGGVIYLPGEQFNILTTVKVSGQADKSIMEYLETNNYYTKTTGQPLQFRNLRYLEGAGAGGADRMIIQADEARNFWMPMPLPLQLLEPQPKGYGVSLLAEYIFGTFHVKQPGALYYMDGI